MNRIPWRDVLGVVTYEKFRTSGAEPREILVTDAARHPTDAELRILKVLWKRGPSTARDVMDALTDERAVGYTTVLKTLQVMEGKGLVTVDRAARSHVYEARVARDATLGGLVTRLVDSAFDGAAGELLVHLVAGDVDADALRDLEQRIAALRREEGAR